jgi:hypothetical protein
MNHLAAPSMMPIALRLPLALISVWQTARRSAPASNQDFPSPAENKLTSLLGIAHAQSAPNLRLLG